MAAPSNSSSDNYAGFKLFATLCPQSNFRINLRFDRELVVVLPASNCVLGLLRACYHSRGRPRAPGEQDRWLLQLGGEKSIDQSMRAHLIKGNKGSGCLMPLGSVSWCSTSQPCLKGDSEAVLGIRSESSRALLSNRCPLCSRACNLS